MGNQYLRKRFVSSGLNMRYVAAALLSVLGGKEVESKNIVDILGSVGIEADLEKIKLVVKELAGKDIEQLIVEGQSKLATMPSGGGGGAPVATSGATDKGQEDAAPKEAAKEEPEEESDDDMGFGLFD